MKKYFKFSEILVLVSVFLLIVSSSLLSNGCIAQRSRSRDDRGEAFAVQKRNGRAWKMEAPLNMVLVAGGSFLSGPVDDDPYSHTQINKRVTVLPLYVDTTQVTNVVYRKFTDSIAEKYGKEDKATKSEGDSDDISDAQDNSVAQPAAEAADDVGGDDSDEIIMKDKDEEHHLSYESIVPNMDEFRASFKTAMLDFMLTDYATHEAFDDYPVMFVSYEAIQSFMEWCTSILNEWRGEMNMAPMPKFRLPTAFEWQYLASGGNPLIKTPVGSSLVDSNGEPLASFKTCRGTYNSGGILLYPVDHFPCNDYGLYIGQGVPEWTSTTYSHVGSSIMGELSPTSADDGSSPLKVVKGCAFYSFWFLGTTGYENCAHEKEHPPVGFRRVMDCYGVF